MKGERTVLRARREPWANYAGAWVCRGETLLSLAMGLNRTNLRDHIRAAEVNAAIDGPPGVPDMEIRDDGVAYFSIVGETSKYGSSLMSGPSTDRLRRALRLAADNQGVRLITLVIDSPGGMAAGIDDLFRDILAIREIKPVLVYAQDWVASGAYWFSSAATRIIANPSGWVGSIGAYHVLLDLSQAADAEGIKIEVITSDGSPLKGQEEEGLPITDALRAEVRTHLNVIYDQFVAAIAAGRGLDESRVRAAATGAMYPAKEALALGLIDGIGGLEENVAAMLGGLDIPENPDIGRRMEPERTTPAAQSTNQEHVMAKSETKVQAATAEELAAALPNADERYRQRCVEQGLTAEQSSGMWEIVQELMQESQPADTAAAAKPEAAKVTAAAPVTEPAAPKVAGPDIFSARLTKIEEGQAQITKQLETFGGILGRAAHTTVAFASGEDAAGADDGPDEWKKQFAADPALRREFKTEGSYVNYRKAQARGAVIGKVG